MKILSSLEQAAGLTGDRVLAIGNFDGVHKGHQLVFQTALDRAREAGSKAVIMTFSRHPSVVVAPGQVPKPLMAVKDRLLIAERFGFDEAFVLDFNAQLAGLLPEKFVDEVLVELMRVSEIVAGESWRFGRDRRGNMTMLKRMGSKRGFSVHVVRPQMIDDLPVSSTRIRGALQAGDVTAAASLLGRPHFVRGKVVRGQGRGRVLGFPTVNLDCSRILVPGDGVYSGGFMTPGTTGDEELRISGTSDTGQIFRGPAAISIGSSPTFENGAYAVEAHLVGWEKDIYGSEVTLTFHQRLRDQYSFPDAAGLADQMAADVARSRDLFSNHDLREIPF